MKIIQQYKDKTITLIEDKKTIDWLTNKTYVETFDPVTFQGYQRMIDSTHIERMKRYLETSTLLPTAIICAVDDEYDSNAELRIVDGQHRVEAFKQIKSDNKELYSKIKNNEMPIIVLEGVEKKVEVETFININKTSKKVDTSLAMVLKHNLEYENDNPTLSRREYLAVETALRLNEHEGSIWRNAISFEGSVKNTTKYISLNAFVVATRGLFAQMNREGIISLEWGDKGCVDDELNKCITIVTKIWEAVYKKWYTLFDQSEKSREIVQGVIGYTAICKYITLRLKMEGVNTYKELIEKKLYQWIFEITVDERNWIPGGYYSGFASGSGHAIVAKDLLYSTGINE